MDGKTCCICFQVLLILIESHHWNLPTLPLPISKNSVASNPWSLTVVITCVFAMWAPMPKNRVATTVESHAMLIPDHSTIHWLLEVKGPSVLPQHAYVKLCSNFLTYQSSCAFKLSSKVRKWLKSCATMPNTSATLMMTKRRVVTMQQGRWGMYLMVNGTRRCCVHLWFSKGSTQEWHSLKGSMMSLWACQQMGFAHSRRENLPLGQ